VCWPLDQGVAQFMAEVMAHSLMLGIALADQDRDASAGRSALPG